MGVKAVKFGGSSLADAGQFQKVREILLSDPARRFVVPSAPGRRFDGDDKVTDLLYRCHFAARAGENGYVYFEKAAARYREIAAALHLKTDVDALLQKTFAQILENGTPDFAASRGEYLCGRLLADCLGWDFVDPREFIRFDRRGVFASEWTNEVLRAELKKHECAVVPGFYGSFPDGEVRTFSRGGSDITGAVVARAIDAELYENWTDVSGFLMADPRIVPNPRGIREMTYQELRELSYMGATVLHEESIFPVRVAGIPTQIKNTNDPSHPGTMILARPSKDGGVITGIAGHKNFTLISIEKGMMNAERGFGRRVLQVLDDFDISFEHLPTGIDTMSVVISTEELSTRRGEILKRLNEACQPDSIEMTDGIALIATVGHGMVRNPGTAARLFAALDRAHVNVRMIDQGSSELNIIVGVDSADFETAVRAIYGAFEKNGE